jgi:hypothetical protein
MGLILLDALRYEGLLELTLLDALVCERPMRLILLDVPKHEGLHGLILSDVSLLQFMLYETVDFQLLRRL